MKQSKIKRATCANDSENALYRISGNEWLHNVCISEAKKRQHAPIRSQAGEGSLCPVLQQDLLGNVVEPADHNHRVRMGKVAS